MADTAPLARLIERASDVRANEWKATLVSFAFVFVLMASYFVLRPVRDAMASDWSDGEVSLLWTINFFVSAGIVALFGFAVSRVRLRAVIPGLYGFFALSFVAFFLAVGFVDDRTLVDKGFYLWVSVYALFHVSVFWSLMADTFNPAQARRLFAIIGAGASAGALVGPAIVTLLATDLGTDRLMMIAATSLTLIIPMVFYLYRLKATELGNADHELELDAGAVGGRWWTGFWSFVTNSYLLGIGTFILLYVFIGSFVYFEQKNLLADFSRDERTQILGSIDWLVNTLTFGLAFFATGRIATRLGLGVTLALVPVLVMAGLLVLAFAPVITVLLALQVVRRSGNYAVTRPAREMLFTAVGREDRFKAKPVIDIVVYRGGDAVSGNLFALLTEGVGLGLAAVALVGAAIAAAWAAVGVALGRHFKVLTGGGPKR